MPVESASDSSASCAAPSIVSENETTPSARTAPQESSSTAAVAQLNRTDQQSIRPLRWIDAVWYAVQRFVNTKNQNDFTRKELIREQLLTILQETASTTGTPMRTTNHILDELIALNKVIRVSRGRFMINPTALNC